MILILGAYSLLQTDRISSRDLSYSLMNAVGALLLVVSLLFDFNLAALIVEGFWAIISIFGIVRCTRSRLDSHAAFQGNAPEAGARKSRKL
jgi:hypothetical protein